MPAQTVYNLSRITGAPNFDSLPVAKITDYPLEERDYKPFAQCILCASEDELHLRMWAFEVSPASSSALGCVLYCFPQQPDKAIGFSVQFLEREQAPAVVNSVGFLLGGEELPVSPEEHRKILQVFRSHPHNGEDLQGAYWGSTLTMSLELIRQLGGKISLNPGDEFPGNFFKTCEDERFGHMGSYAPALFPGKPYHRDSMGVFRVVAY